MPKRLTSLSGINSADPVWNLEARIRALSETYRKRQERLTRMLLKSNLTSFQRFRAEEILKQVRLETTYLNRKAVEFARATSPRAYQAGWEVAKKSAIEAGIDRSVNFGNQVNTRSVRVITDQISKDLVSGNESMRKNVTNLIRQTQQQVLNEEAINRSIADGLVEGQTRRQVSDDLQRQFREQLGEQRFITAGKRQFTPEEYSELVARTRTREAAAQGTVNGAVQYGMDLVQIDVHGDACPFCRTRMGRVYSVTGNHPDFPKLDRKPPFHPNCECNIFGVNESTLRRRGQYDKLVELSNRPQFDNGKDAKNWLEKNPDADIATLTDYHKYLKTTKPPKYQVKKRSPDNLLDQKDKARYTRYLKEDIGIDKDLDEVVGGIVPESLHEGSKVSVSPTYLGGKPQLEIRIEHKDKGVQAIRHLYRDGDNLVVKNSWIEVAPGQSGRGLGGRLFAEQVKGSKAIGINRFDTRAVRGKSMNGYYTWPRLGYDGPVPKAARNKMKLDPKIENVGELLEIPGGRELWKKSGNTAELSFDLSDGSKSMNKLTEYLDAKGIREELGF